jgi:hypothetical protein
MAEHFKEQGQDIMDKKTMDLIDELLEARERIDRVVEKLKNPKMVTAFEVGKYYRFAGSKDTTASLWNRYGLMDAVLDGKPRMCILAKGDMALFDQMASGWNVGRMWSWEPDQWEESSAEEYNKAWVTR